MPQPTAPAGQNLGLIPVSPVYGYDDQSGVPGALPQTSPVTERQLPSWARASNLFITGHSYSAINATPYGDLSVNQLTHPRSQWSQAFAEMLGMSDATRYIVAPVPAAAAATDQVTIIGVVPEHSTIEAVHYVPDAAVTGANTNSRTLQLLVNTLLAAGQVVANLPLVAGTNLVSPLDVGATGTSHTFNLIAAPNQVVAGTQNAFRDGSNAYLPLTQSDQVLVGTGTVLSGAALVWKSLHVGTGLADPGGWVIVRLGNRVRNCAVSGSVAVSSGCYAGGWATFRSFRPLSAYVSVEVNVSVTAAQGAVALTLGDGLTQPIASGTTIRFANGVSATTTANAAVNATSLSVAALPAQIPAGTQGAPTPAYDANIPRDLFCIFQGLNDASVPVDIAGYREAMRYMMAHALCPYTYAARHSNTVYVNGTNGAWALVPTTKPGAIPQPVGNNTLASMFTASGALGGTLPSATTTIAPDIMDGDCIDLFFYALVGTNRGARATISVDGVPWAVIDTSGVATLSGSAALSTHTLTATTTNGAATLTATVGTFSDPADIGRYVTGPGVPANTQILSITDSTHATLTQNSGAGAGSGTVNLIPFLPMVKRLAGVQAGVAHTVQVQITSIDATDGTAGLIFAEYGIESNNPRAAVLVPNVPRIPNKAYASDANVQQFNAELARVVNDTPPAPGVGSTEPPLPASVVLVDIDTLMGNQSQFFTVDGIHPNARGHGVIAQAMYDAVRVNFSSQQLVSR